MKNRGLEKTYLAPVAEGCWQSNFKEALLPANYSQVGAPLLANYAQEVAPLFSHRTSVIACKCPKHNKSEKTKSKFGKPAPKKINQQ